MTALTFRQAVLVGDVKKVSAISNPRRFMAPRSETAI
jgi:hypothetical protein